MAGHRYWKPIATTAIMPLLAVVITACGGSSSGSSTKHSQHKNAAPVGAKSNVVTIATTTGTGQTHLVGASGRSIYLWVADKSSKSTCSGACALNWPPVITKGAPSAGHGVNAADLGTTTRSDGSKQVTYNGHPLYYYVGDPTAGTTSGQGSDGFGAKWWLVAASGKAITASGSGSSSASGY